MRSHVGLNEEPPVDVDVKSLLQQILENVDNGFDPSSIAHTNETTEEVVLRVWVEEAYYTLTRTVKHTQSTQTKVCLSPREQEIVRLVIKGLPNKTIAAVLEISPWTVATHLRRVYTKLGVNSRAEMVARVLKGNMLGSAD